MPDEGFGVVVVMRSCRGSRQRLGKTLAQSPSSAYADAPPAWGYSPAIRLPARNRARLRVMEQHMIFRASVKLMHLSIRWDKAIEGTQHRKTIFLGLLDSPMA
jgi:hypothetical protein